MWPVWSGCDMTCFCWLTGTTTIYSVDKHDCESPWLCDVNRGNSYSSLAIFSLHWLTLINSFQWPQN